MSVGVIIVNSHPEYLFQTVKSVIANSEAKNIYLLDDKDCLKQIFKECTPHKWEEVTFKGVSIKLLNITRKMSMSTKLNSALEIALPDKNKYTVFLTSKEELKENFLKRSIEYLESSPSFVGGVYTDFDRLKIPYSFVPIRNFLQSFDRQKIIRGLQIPLTSLIITEVIQKIGVFDTQLQILPEWDYWIRFTEVYPLFHLPESLYIHRELVNEPNNISAELLEFTQAYVINKAEQRAKDGK